MKRSLGIPQRISQSVRASRRYFTLSARDKRLETIYKDILSGSFMEQHPGLAISVVSLSLSGDPSHWRRFEGFSNMDSKRPIDANTVFRIGSVSKTITALCTIFQTWRFDILGLSDFQLALLKVIMNLAESGHILSIDEPVYKLLSPRHAALLRGRFARDVTVRHLLAHTSGCAGLYQWKDLMSTHANLGWPKKSTLPEPSFSEYYSSRGGLQFNRPPGEEYVYSNHAFAILGQIIEGSFVF